MEREWSCYGGGQFNGGSVHVTEVARLRENGHVTEVVKDNPHSPDLTTTRW